MRDPAHYGNQFWKLMGGMSLHKLRKKSYGGNAPCLPDIHAACIYGFHFLEGTLDDAAYLS